MHNVNAAGEQVLDAAGLYICLTSGFLNIHSSNLLTHAPSEKQCLVRYWHKESEN